MNTRYMERTNSMRGKRSLENDDNDEDKDKQQPERKRPALARFIHSFDFILPFCFILIATASCFPLIFKLGFNNEFSDFL